MYVLSKFGFNDMMDCRARLRALFESDEPATIGEGAQRIVDFLYDELVDDDGRPACALIRLFKSHRFDALDDELREFAQRIAPEAANLPNVRCLVLTATRGIEPQWNSRHSSTGHKAIPLMSEKMIDEAPMISQLIRQLGVPVSAVLRPTPELLLDQREQSYNVFHVPTALGSPYIVAQESFVQPYGIASVLGFGGMVASGDLFAAILFSRSPISSR
jgi:hypothetical protein